MASRGWGPTGPGAWYETDRGPRALSTNLFVPRKECAPELVAPAPDDAPRPRAADAPHRPGLAEEHARPAEPAEKLPKEPAGSAAAEPAGDDGLPPPSPPTADAYQGADGPEVQPMGPPPPGAPPELGPLGLGGAAAGDGTCGDPACPFCETRGRTCQATGKSYHPISRESCAVYSAMIGPVLARLPYRGVDPEKIPPGAFDLSDEERGHLDNALYLFLRKRAAVLGPLDDITALIGAALIISAPRFMHARTLREAA